MPDLTTARRKRWSPISKPVCGCTHSLSLFCVTLASVYIPKVLLPGVTCPCGRTWLRWRDGKLFEVPEGMDAR